MEGELRRSLISGPFSGCGVPIFDATHHFKEMTLINGREEMDTLAAFMCSVKKFKRREK